MGELTANGHAGEYHKKRLHYAAVRAQSNAHAPYSGFRVGAAVLVYRPATVPHGADDYRVFGGCNVENAAFGSTICAERGAIMAAIAAGASPQRIVACYVIGPTKGQITPCGSCRQFLAEFSPTDNAMAVFGGNCDGVGEWTTLAELLPQQFPDSASSAAIKRTGTGG